MLTDHEPRLETKFARFGEALSLSAGEVIEGYASLFGTPDQGKDIVTRGAYAASLVAHQSRGSKVKMLWQHDPAQPIGVWEEVREDATGLWVKGRILESVEKGREASALLQAGAIDGLSIGYRTLRTTKDGTGRRLLTELELWEVSLVTFPMLPSARVAAKGTRPDEAAMDELAQALERARRDLARSGARRSGTGSRP